MRTKSIFGLAIIAPSAVIAAGCNSILGDFTVAGDDGSGDGMAGTPEGGGDDASIVDAADATTTDAAADTSQDGSTPDTSSDASPTCSADQLLCGNRCVANDATNCGTCGHDCTRLAHVGSSTGVTCSSGVCSIPQSACQSGFGHCSANADDGCETDLSQTVHCGSCTQQCGGGTPLCAPSSGSYACASGCPASAPTLCNGACVNLNTDPQHCHDCATVCMPPDSLSHGTCTAGSCGFACNQGAHSCGNDCYADTDINHCGASCVPCSAPPAGGTEICNGSACDFTCSGNLSKCNGACVDETSDINNCGACGHSCPGSCANSSCAPPVITCASESLNGFFYFRPQAAEPTSTPGGMIQIGDYKLYEYYGPSAGGYAGGTATAFVQGNNLFLRYYLSFGLNGANATYGTRWMQYDASGNLTQTELCDAATKGTVTTGTYEMRTSVSPNELFIRYGTTREEVWQRQ
jgi:hypothetical protein